MSITMRTRLRIAALTPLLLLSVALNSAHAKDPSLLTLSSEHFKDTATVSRHEFHDGDRSVLAMPAAVIGRYKEVTKSLFPHPRRVSTLTA